MPTVCCMESTNNDTKKKKKKIEKKALFWVGDSFFQKRLFAFETSHARGRSKIRLALHGSSQFGYQSTGASVPPASHSGVLQFSNSPCHSHRAGPTQSLPAHAASPVGQELIPVSRRCTNTSNVPLGLEVSHQSNFSASTELLLSATGGRGAGFRKPGYRSTQNLCALQVR